MTNLYIDFDGVICDTIDVSYELLAKEGIEKTDFEGCRIFYENLDWEYVLSVCHILNDGMDCIRKLIDSGKFNVAILTHVNSINEIIHKVHYIREFFPDLTIIPVPKDISKTKMIETKGAILVYDFVENLNEWNAEGGIAIRFDLDMDGKGYPVIDRLDTLLSMFD